MIHLTNQQARRFLLLKHGLLGEHRFVGKQGALDFVSQAGCIQFDPVDACGKNAELTLQSRVKGFTKQTLYDLLYVDRQLVDYPDKNLAILPTTDWPYFERYRAAARSGASHFPELAELEQYAKEYIAANGPVSSDELPIEGTIRWHSMIHWSGNWCGETKASRSVLEQLYSTGELVIHHKNGSRKYYDLAEKHIPAHLLHTPEPLPDDFDHIKWRVLRRIGGVGMLWDKPSDAWLNIWGLDTNLRKQAFRALLDEGKLLALTVEGIPGTLYCRAEDTILLDVVLQQEDFRPRCELIAPLDCMLWDRKLIKALFGFHYAWEIYTPAVQRKYGFYVLPLLYGDRFVGRVEAVADRKTCTLLVKNIWFEEGVRQTKKLQASVDKCILRFARFNACNGICYSSSDGTI